MKTITLLLEEDETMILRSQVRMMELMLPESNEMIERFIKKILDATEDLSPEWKKEIGKMQRAMRVVKLTDEYAAFRRSFEIINKMIMEEIGNENNV